MVVHGVRDRWRDGEGAREASFSGHAFLDDEF